MPTQSLDDMLAAQTARWNAMTDNERSSEAFEWWNRFPEECERLRYTSQNLVLDLVQDRARRRYAALTAYDEIEAKHRRVLFDAELAAADADLKSAMAEWHARYDHLWPEPGVD
jgi:hypothetical protein